jgi:type II secretory pathway component PulF
MGKDSIMAIEFLHDQIMEAGTTRGAGTDGVQGKWSALFQPRVTAKDRVLFIERLSLQIAAGVTLHSALLSLHAQADKPGMKAVVTDLIQSVVEGRKFSEALAKHPELFPSTHVNLIAASEGGSFLPEVLDQLREMDEKQERLRATLTAAFSYPVFLIVFSVAVVLFILAVVFPKFAVMFASIRNDLPITTRILMSASELLLNHPVRIVAVIAVIVGSVAFLLSQPAGKIWCDRMKLRIPGLRQLFIQIYLTRLMRTMGISLERGVTILATLGACREVVQNKEFQEFIARLEQDVTEGKGIAAGFKGTHFIPPSVLQMIATGEETGQLGHVMGRIADFYDRELTKRLNQLAKLAEPVMLLVMGGIVGVIVSSLILPIFKLSKAVH